MKDDKDPIVDTRKKPILTAFLIIIIIISWYWCWWWPQSITTVYISRHAEKQTTSGNPALSVEGQIRAGELAHVLKDEGIDVVFVTQYLRTQQTGQPTATVAGVSVIEYNATAPQDAVDAILENYIGKKILVIGHSDTVDDITAGLGATGVSELTESQYDRLFVVHRFGSVVHMDRLRYGVATP